MVVKSRGIGAAIWRRTMRVSGERRVVGKPGFVSFEYRMTGGGGAQRRRFISSQCTRAHVELIESCLGLASVGC